MEYEALERFSLMTENGVDDITALKEIQKEYGREAAIELWNAYSRGKYDGDKRGK